MAIGAFAFVSFQTHSSQTKNNVHDLFLAGSEALASDSENTKNNEDLEERNCSKEVTYCRKGGWVEKDQCTEFSCLLNGHKSITINIMGIEFDCIAGDRLTPAECTMLAKGCQVLE